MIWYFVAMSMMEAAARTMIAHLLVSVHLSKLAHSDLDCWFERVEQIWRAGLLDHWLAPQRKRSTPI